MTAKINKTSGVAIDCNKKALPAKPELTTTTDEAIRNNFSRAKGDIQWPGTSPCQALQALCYLEILLRLGKLCTQTSAFTPLDGIVVGQLSIFLTHGILKCGHVLQWGED